MSGRNEQWQERWVRPGHSESGQAWRPGPVHQKAKQRSLGWPTRSRLGRQAYWIMGGGPHISTSGSSSGGGRWSRIISSFTKPWL